MLITNALAVQFGAPPNYTALIISCLFGLVVFAATLTALWLRLVFWVLNSLIIFSIGLGTNQLGVKASKNLSIVSTLPMPLEDVSHPYISLPITPLKKFFANWLDGTVPRRKTLLIEVSRIDYGTAQATLSELAVGRDGEIHEFEKWFKNYNAELTPELAKLFLEKSAATAQTSEKVLQIEYALTKAKLDEKNKKPR